MSYRRTVLKQTISTGLLFVSLNFTGSAWSQSLPHNEQQFCNAFPIFREALKQARKNSTGDSPHQQRQLRQAVAAATKDFRRGAGSTSAQGGPSYSAADGERHERDFTYTVTTLLG